VSGYRVGLHAQRLGHDDRVEEYGRLGDFSLFELFVRTGEHDVGDAETEDFVGLLEESLGFGNVVVEVFAHADGLSALTRKYVCVFHSFCQNIFWLPGKDSKYFLTFALQRFTRGYAPSD